MTTLSEETFEIFYPKNWSLGNIVDFEKSRGLWQLRDNRITNSVIYIAYQIID